MKIIMRAAIAAAGLVTLVALAACGGGGSDGGGGNVAPPAASKTINANKNLDVTWGAGFGLTRLELLNTGVERAFRTVMTAGDASNPNYPCQSSGFFSYVRNGNARSITFNQCGFTINTFNVVFVSGTVSINDGVVGTIAGPYTVFTSGTFNIANVGINWGVGPESVNGILTYARQPNGSVNATSAAITVTRNGRDDRYSTISFATAVPDVSGAASIQAGAFGVASARIPFSFTATGADNYLLATAADNSAAQIVFDATGQSATYSVYANYAAGAPADLTRVLASTDPAVQAAIQRLLQ
jgi:hypothetical protein